MKLVTFTTDGSDRLGILHETRGVLELPGDMLSFIAAGSSALASACRALDTALNAKTATWRTIDEVRLRAPIPLPRKNVFCVGRNYKAHIIATGTPSGVALGMSPQRWLQDGDRVEAEVEGIGRLQNRVKKVA